MKFKNLKRFASLALSLMMMTSMVVHADVASTVTFDKDKKVVVQDLFDNFKGVMPGDERTETITIQNDCTDYDYVKVYMRAEANTPENIQSVDNATQETVDQMNAFLAQLKMTVKAGDEVIFHATPDQQTGLVENVYLGTLEAKKNMTLDVALNVPIEMGSEFAYRTGEVDWVFTMEAFDYPAPPVSNYTTYTAQKVWVDNGAERPDSIVVHLLKNGEYYDEAVLNEENQWVYTWSKLIRWNDWDVVEAEVPAGYDVSYDEQGTTTIITNTATNITITDPETPLGTVIDYSVKKVWDDEGKNRPTQVKVTLYQGENAVEAVWLGDWNNWSYTWNDVVDSGNLKVVETEIPKGYAPSYSREGDVVTITNTATLIQTGQLNWPIVAMGGLGTLFIALGLLVILKKRDTENA